MPIPNSKPLNGSRVAGSGTTDVSEAPINPVLPLAITSAANSAVFTPDVPPGSSKLVGVKPVAVRSNFNGRLAGLLAPPPLQAPPLKLHVRAYSNSSLNPSPAYDPAVVLTNSHPAVRLLTEMVGLSAFPPETA